MEKLENNAVEKVSGGKLDLSKKALSSVPSVEQTCESCGKTFISYTYGGARPTGNIFDREVRFDQFSFDNHGRFCPECMQKKFDSHWEGWQNALKNHHSDKQ